MTDPTPAPFGTRFAPRMSWARWADDTWSDHELVETAPFPMHPAAHALHYGSSCFEGLKAHRGVDGSARVFRLDSHVRRLQGSAAALSLPVPPAELAASMVVDLVRDAADVIPPPPGSLYLRPTLLGTTPNIGAAAHPTDEAVLFVLASPVGDYFAGGDRPLVVAVETERLRTTPQFGAVKTGANYAMALVVTLEARRELGVDQVLFAPGGDVQETGASNVVLIDPERVVTPKRSGLFLSGVTLDSLLHLAASLGYEIEERTVSADEVLAWAARPSAEIALSGTAAVLAGVGSLVHHGQRLPVGTGDVGEHTRRLRQALAEVQRGVTEAPVGWITVVS